MKSAPRPRLSLARVLPWLLIVGSVLGFVSSFILSYDELQLARNASFTPNCNLNPIISCGSVMESAAGAVFGFPNSWIGLATFAIVGTVGVILLAGAVLKRWFWRAFTAGLGAGFAFAYWLLFVSIYHIQALCPFCLTVDVALTTMFWYVLLHVAGMESVNLPKIVQRAAAVARKHHLEILVVWFLIILALILQHFWYYYGQFI